MKRRFCIVCYIVIVAKRAWAGPYDDGVAAYDQGRFDTAFALWLPLAERWHAAARFNLGVLFEKGLGVTQDYAEAARWYMKAAEQGDEQAQYNIAVLYEKGVGLSLDLDRARYWYEKVLANPRADRGGLKTKQRARQQLAHLYPPEEVTAYEGGRSVVRRSLSGDCVIALQGIVSNEASFKFDDVVKKAAANGCGTPLMLLLESPGGSLIDGITLGREVRFQGLRTVARYDCASACGMIFLGGAERVLARSRARIGFHQASFQTDKDKWCIDSTANSEAEKIRRYLRFVIPANADRVFRMVMETSCNSIEWSYGQNALELGVATTLESEGVDVFGPKADR